MLKGHLRRPTQVCDRLLMVQPAVSALHLKHHLLCQHEKQRVFGPPMQEAVCQPPMATPPAGTTQV